MELDTIFSQPNKVNRFTICCKFMGYLLQVSRERIVVNLMNVFMGTLYFASSLSCIFFKILVHIIIQNFKTF